MAELATANNATYATIVVEPVEIIPAALLIPPNDGKKSYEPIRNAAACGA
jgi:hypothetical protein